MAAKPPLSSILQNRVAVNMLKLLYEQEVADKKAYAAKLSQLQSLLVLVDEPREAVELLQSGELVTTDVIAGVEQEAGGEARHYEELLISITTKGKEFIETLDQLLEVYTGNGPSRRKSNMVVSFDLTRQEKRLLLAGYKLGEKRKTKHVTLKALVTNVFSAKEYKKKVGGVRRTLQKLEQLNLVHVSKEGKKESVLVTPKGFKAVQHEFEKGIEV